MKESTPDRILVVDDDPTVCDVMTLTLQNSGLYAVGFTSAHNALESLKNHEWDLVLTDIYMKEMNGLDFLREIKMLYSDMPVIVITAYASVKTALEAVKNGAEDYLIKPHDIKVLHHRVSKTLDVYRKHSKMIAYQEEMDRKLYESEMNYRTLADNANDGICIINNKEKIIYGNSRLSEITGYDKDELQNKKMEDIIHKDDLEKSRERFKNILAGLSRPEQFESVLLKKDGAVCQVEVTASRTVWKGETAGLGIVRDISKRKQVEEKVSFERDQFLAIFEKSEEAIYVIDPETYIILYSNNVLDKTFGKLAGKICYEALQGLDSPCPFCTNDKIFGENEGKTHIWEHHNKKSARWYRYIDRAITWPDGRIVRYEMAIDITERKIAEERLSNRLRYERAITDCSRLLLKNTNPDEAFTSTLKNLLSVTKASRVYIFENFEDEKDGLCTRQVYEVCAPGVKSEINNPELQHFPYKNGIMRWESELSEGRPVAGIVDTFPESEQDILKSQDIQSILILPVFSGDTWRGFIGFDDVESKREWIYDDINLLRTVAHMSGQYTERIKIENQLKEAHDVLEERVKERTKELDDMNKKLRLEIQERMMAVTALQESEEKFSSVVKTASSAIITTDTNGRIVFWNKAAEEIFGYNENEAADKVISDLVPAKYFHGSKNRIKGLNRYYETNVSGNTIEISAVDKSGIEFPVQMSLAQWKMSDGTYYTSIMSDITERKKAEEIIIKEHAKQEKLLLYKSIIAEISFMLNSDDPLYLNIIYLLNKLLLMLKVENINFCFFDPSYEKVFYQNVDINEEETKCKSELRRIPPEKFNDTPFILEHLKNGENYLFSNLNDLDEKERGFFEKEDIQSAIFAPINISETIAGMAIIANSYLYKWEPEVIELFRTIVEIIANALVRNYNVYAKLEAEKKQTQAVQLAEKASRLASLGTLTAGIAHEINQPLTVIKASADEALFFKDTKQELSSDEIYDNFKTITEQTSRIDDIISHLRMMVKQEKVKKIDRMDLNSILKRAVSLLEKQLLLLKIDLQLDLDETLPDTGGHLVQMEEVIINIVNNAAQAFDLISKENKKIIISTSCDSKSCVLAISDNGPGISDENMNNIFEPLFSTKSEQKGMGLGLALTKNIIESFNGTISASNCETGGAQFTVTLPVY